MLTAAVGDRDYSHRRLIDKLGVKPGQRVSVVGVIDGPFWQQLRERTDDVSDGDPRPDSDAILYAAMEPADLARLTARGPPVQALYAKLGFRPVGERLCYQERG